VAGLRQRRDDRLLRDWLRAVPEDVARRRPLLATQLAWVRLSEGDVGAVDAWLDAAEEGLEAAGDDPDAVPAASPPALAGAVHARNDELAGLPAMVAVYRASVAQARGDVDGTVRHARRALDLTGPDDHMPRGAAGGFLGLAAWAAGDLSTAVDTFGAAIEELRAAGNVTDVLGATVLLAAMWSGRGRLDEARRLLERALESVAARPGPGSSVAGDLHVALAEVLREEGVLVGAEHHLEVARELGDRGSLLENRHRWFTVSAAVLRARGDVDSAVAMLVEAAALLIPGMVPEVRPIPAQLARLRIAQGRLADAREWATGRGVTLTDEPTYLAEFDHLTLARLVLAEHRFRAGGDGGDGLDEVVRMLDAVLAGAADGDRQGSVIEATFLRALAHHAAGDLDAALADLGADGVAWLAVAAAAVAIGWLLGRGSAASGHGAVDELADYERVPIPYATVEDDAGVSTTLRLLTAERARLLVLLSLGCGPCTRIAERLDAWRDTPVTTLLVGGQDPDTLRLLADLTR
jgi:LuxR family maltose regulon positive regulatory protein